MILNGIEVGYKSGNLTLTKNWWGAGANTGEIGVSGTSITKVDDTILSLGNVNNGVACIESDNLHGYLMYSIESVHTRFSAVAPHPDNADHLIFISYSSGQWYYDNNTVDTAFTPISSDLIVADVVRGVDSVSTITTQDGVRLIQTFNQSGIFTSLNDVTVKALLVGGGGGGGGSPHGGGGGAGGIYYNENLAVTAQTYAIVVGGGGAGKLGTLTSPWPSAGTNYGEDGGDTTFAGKTAIGGGGGGGYSGGGANDTDGRAGGSGGGGTDDSAAGAGQQPGSTDGGFGNAGGTSTTNEYSKGGGGAGERGDVDGLGYGGDGKAYSISGSSVYYAGGGGGAFFNVTDSISNTGGLGGGGNSGSSSVSPYNPGDGVDGLGGGGGGAERSASGDGRGGAGGDGVVIISYLSDVATTNYLRRPRRTRSPGKVSGV